MLRPDLDQRAWRDRMKKAFHISPGIRLIVISFDFVQTDYSTFSTTPQNDKTLPDPESIVMRLYAINAPIVYPPPCEYLTPTPSISE